MWILIPCSLLMIFFSVRYAVQRVQEEKKQTARFNAQIARLVEENHPLELSELEDLEHWFLEDAKQLINNMQGEASEDEMQDIYDEVHAKFELRDQLMAKESYEDYLAEFPDPASILDKEVLNRRYEKMEDLGGWRVCFSTLNRNSRWLIFIVPLLFAGIFSSEWQGGMNALIFTTPLGRKRLFRHKLSLALTASVVLFLLSYLLPTGIIYRSFALSDSRNLPFYLLDAYTNLPFTLGETLRLTLALRFLAFMALILFSLMMSQLIHNEYAAMVSSEAISLFPLVLSNISLPSVPAMQAVNHFYRLFPAATLTEGHYPLLLPTVDISSFSGSVSLQILKLFLIQGIQILIYAAVLAGGAKRAWTPKRA